MARPARWAVGAALALVALAALLWVGRDQWSFYDEWSFIGPVRADWAEGRHLEALFAPHNEHWSTLPVLLFGATFRLVGLRSYLPYLALVLAMHVGVAALVRVILARAGAPALAAWMAAALVLVLGAGWENLLWAFQTGFVGALLFGLAQLVLTDHDGPVDRRDLLGLAAGLAGLACSGIAVTMVAVVGLALAIRGRAGVPGPTTATLGDLPRYVWHGLRATAEGVAGLEAAGVVVLAGVAVFLATRTAPQLRALAPVLPAAVLALGQLDRGRRWPVATAGVLGWATLANGTLLVSRAHARAGEMAQIRDVVLASAQLPGIDQVDRSRRPEPGAPALTLAGARDHDRPVNTTIER